MEQQHAYLLLFLALVAVTGSGAVPACGMSTVTNVGYTYNDTFYNVTQQPEAGACCALCAADSKCYAWTFHTDSKACSLGVRVVSAPVNNTVSGHKAGPPPPPPPPQPPCKSPPPVPTPPKGDKPNIILFLMDDQDKYLGGWEPLTKATRLLSEQGATANNWMIHTAVCCPSRAELLTSRYFHNIKVPNPSDKNCMHASTDAEGPFNSWLFAPHLQQAGYEVGLFGKYLNTDVPLCPPPGISVGGWLANGGGNYMNPEFNVDGKSVTFNNGTYADYSTSVIGNVSTAWVTSKLQGDRPFFAYIAPKAPHIEDGSGFPVTIPAPWYNDSFPGVQAPRTPNYNYSAPDHHWLIAQQPPMTAEQAMHSDILFRARWQSLLSVDDLIESVVTAVAAAGQLNNTYFFSTSDHGYRFGQFRMPMGKWNVYENDIRIPMVMRGPGIARNSTFDYIASNVDVMPTILGLAGVERPSTMDGRSIAPFLVNAEDATVSPSTRRHLAAHVNGPAWRTELLLEYYGLGEVERYGHLADTYNNTYRALRVVDGDDNLLVAEFTDVRTNYNFTADGDFYEMFDLNEDPYQLKNIFNTTPVAKREALLKKLRKLYTCQGDSCN